jgi:hypothetical protein
MKEEIRGALQQPDQFNEVTGFEKSVIKKPKEKPE